MWSAAEYLVRTDGATRILLSGIESYVGILNRAPVPIFGGTFTGDAAAHRTAFDHWLSENEEQVRLSLKSQRDFSAESFALATLCGCLLQIAAMGIQWFSDNTVIPDDFSTIIKPSTTAVSFCIGRRVRGVPIGLVIYAGRNQFAHLNEEALRESNVTIFDLLARNHGYQTDVQFKDPAFDLQNEQLVNLASNITGLLEWRSYDAYEMDMRKLLGNC